jgi:ankyrin repeat protein
MYACEFWLDHTCHLTDSSPSWLVWEKLVCTEAAPTLFQSTSHFGFSALEMFIAERRHQALLVYSMQKRVNFLQADFKSMLCTAAGHGWLEFVALLVESYDLSRSDLGYALCSASAMAQPAVVRWLISKGADAEVQRFCLTALQHAAKHGHGAILNQLLAAGSDIHRAPSADRGCTVLQAAAEGGHLGVVDRLLLAKTDVNAPPASYHGRTALEAAAKGGHYAVVDQLLMEKADVNAPSAWYGGRTVLQAAAKRGHLAVVDQLLLAKADVNAPPVNDSGRTALQAAAEGGHFAVVDRLLWAKADVNAPAAKLYGRTALQAAAEGGHLAIVNTLLSARADVNAAPARVVGCIALEAAAEGGHLAVVDGLLLAKADVNYDRSGMTALRAARIDGHNEFCEMLIRMGAKE